MKINNQICSIEQAKKLKALGISQDTLFYFDNLGNTYVKYFPDSQHKVRLSDLTLHNGTTVGEFYAAYNANELAAIIPDYIFYKKDSLRQTGYVAMTVKGHVCLPKTLSDTLTLFDDILPVVMVDILLLLIEAGHITITHCNNQLNTA